MAVVQSPRELAYEPFIRQISAYPSKEAFVPRVSLASSDSRRVAAKLQQALPQAQRVSPPRGVDGNRPGLSWIPPRIVGCMSPSSTPSRQCQGPSSGGLGERVVTSIAFPRAVGVHSYTPPIQGLGSNTPILVSSPPSHARQASFTPAVQRQSCYVSTPPHAASVPFSTIPPASFVPTAIQQHSGEAHTASHANGVPSSKPLAQVDQTENVAARSSPLPIERQNHTGPVLSIGQRTPKISRISQARRSDNLLCVNGSSASAAPRFQLIEKAGQASTELLGAANCDRGESIEVAHLLHSALTGNSDCEQIPICADVDSEEIAEMSFTTQPLDYDRVFAPTIENEKNVLDASCRVNIDCSPPVVEGSVHHELHYLRKNIDHLRQTKRKQEHKMSSLQKEVGQLQEQVSHYKTLYEQAQNTFLTGDHCNLEIGNLHQQLSAVQLVKDALNKENLELHEQLQVLKDQTDTQETRHTPSCVICMDNLVNLVCLPCKHLALCSFCGLQDTVESCPICRSHIEGRMQIYMP
mmetsp:Transcript_80918/g.127401  ORF Transcript_80918/g.127401 Transcript_80918/m.127401 type:complete len:524 (-) Transcript_80918:260-1831(-)